MKILACDSSFGQLSISLFDSEDGEIDFFEETTHSRQAEIIIPSVEKTLKDNSVTYNEIDYFVSTIGPGSFTGVRIGVATFKMLAFASEKQYLGVTTLEATALSALGNNISGEVTIALNALRNQTYTQKFKIKNDEITASSSYEVIDIKQFVEKNTSSNNLIISQDDFLSEYKLNTKIIKYNATNVANHAINLIKSGNNENFRKSPLYIRKPDADLPKISQNVVVG